MLLNKVNEEVEYYILNSLESSDSFLMDEDGNIVGINLPKSLVPAKADYIFVYINNLRAYPDNDYKLKDNMIRFRNKRSSVDNIVVKLYTKHTANEEKINILT